MDKRLLNKFDFGKTPVMAAPDGKTLNIFVFGSIGGWWGANKNDVLLSLKGKSYKNINLVISSNGGDLSEALVIRDLLKAYPANVTAYLTGLCASAATVLADSGNTVVMSKSCMYMIHRPLFEFTMGNADDLRNDARILDQWESIVLDIYNEKTKIGKDVLADMMSDNAKQWMTAEVARSFGFVDEVVEVVDIDFEVDSAGGRPEEIFICEPIYFQNTKTIYNQAVTNALKGGYRQISPVEMQGIKKTNKNSDMNKVFQKVVDLLVSAGVIADAQKEAAMKVVNDAEIATPEMITEIVKTEISKLSPSMNVTDVSKLISEAGDDAKIAIAKALGVPAAYNDAALNEKITAMAAEIASLKVGEGVNKGGNGEDGLNKDGNDKKVLSMKDKEGAKFYREAYENGSIDAKTYESLTGEKPAKKPAK